MLPSISFIIQFIIMDEEIPDLYYHGRYQCYLHFFT